MWVERPRLTHTTSQEPLFPRWSHHHCQLLYTRAPASERCGHARRLSTPTPRGDAQTTHRARAIVLCALRRPTCPQSNAIGRNQTGKEPQQCKHTGASPPYGEHTPDRRQVQTKEKEGGTPAKSSVLMLICVPLPHLVLPLSGCACSGTPTMATRGEARGHP